MLKLIQILKIWETVLLYYNPKMFPALKLQNR